MAARTRLLAVSTAAAVCLWATAAAEPAVAATSGTPGSLAIVAGLYHAVVRDRLTPHRSLRTAWPWTAAETFISLTH